MPVFGYLAIPEQGALERLVEQLSALPHCEVIPADNKEVLILVTDAPNDAEEKKLQNTLKQLDALQSLSMTFGYNDELQKGKGRGDHEA